MSPVSTATFASFGNSANVRSSRLVLPEPGELIRFTQKTSFSRKRSRNDAASRSFSLRTFCSNGTRFMIIDLHVSQFQLIAADALRTQRPARRTLKFIIRDVEFIAAVLATVPSPTNLNLELQALEIGP